MEYASKCTTLLAQKSQGLNHSNPEQCPSIDISAQQLSKEIIQQASRLLPSDTTYSAHELIQRFGSPMQPIYVDQSNVDINGAQYQNPLIMPIYDGQLELIQCAVMQDKSPVSIIPDGLAKGFTYYGDLQKDKPVILTYHLEAFFKIAQTGYAVALVLLPHLCNKHLTELQAFGFKQIQYVIQQLAKAGYEQLYMPVRPEHILLESFQNLEKNTTLRLLNQYQKIGESEFFTELSQYTSKEEVSAFIDEAIALLPEQNSLDKGYLIKPMRWENGHFHITKDGLFFIEKDRNGTTSKRFISSPILVVAKTRDHFSNNWGVLLKWSDDSGTEHTQALSMELFQTDGADLRKALAYQGVMIAPDQKARNLFQCYLMSYPIGRHALCVDRVGWHGDVFILPHEQIGRQSDNDLIVYQSNNALDNRYQSKGTLEQWRSNVSQLIESHSLLVFSLCTAFAGQLLAPLNQQGGGFHFKGGSSKGKSTGLNLACSVWGNPKQFYRTWRATGNALEHTAYMHNDSFLVLDEIGEIANPKELGNIVYMLANGLGKGRMTKQITAKPMHQWKVVFLSSGEKSLKEIMREQGQNTKLGQEIRLADIDIDQSEYGIFDCIDFAEDGAKQAVELSKHMAECYGMAGIAWLTYLTSDKNRIMSEAIELLSQYRNALCLDHSQGHIQRVASYFALVATAGELATRANITGWRLGTAFNAVQKVFNHWLSGFEQVGDYEKREVIAHVKAFFEANESSRFETITPHPEHSERINHRVGYWRIENGDKIFYVLPEQFKNEVSKGFDSRKVAKALLDQGLLEHDTGKNTKTVRLPSRSKAIRVYAIKDSIFSWDNGNIEGNIGNTGNSLGNRGFEPVAQMELQKATQATNTANKIDLPNVAQRCPNRIDQGNSLKASDSGHVACVALVAHEKQQPPKQAVPKRQIKPRQSSLEFEPDLRTIDMFEGML